MGVSFQIRAVRPDSAGGLADLEGPHGRCVVPSVALLELLDRIQNRRSGSRAATVAFPWFGRAFDYDSGRKPVVTDCHRPNEVLASLQAIERELQKNASKYPSEWTFLVPQPEGRVRECRTVNAHYRGKACRLFGDDQGCWAVETDTPHGYPLHYSLAEFREVTVRLEPAAPEVTIGIQRRLPLAVHGEMLKHMKQVCLAAMQAEALVLTAMG